MGENIRCSTDGKKPEMTVGIDLGDRFSRYCVVNQDGEVFAQLNSAQSNAVSVEAFVRFAKTMLLDIATVSQRAQGKQKVRIQNLLFQCGLRYSSESEKFEHLNPCLFNAMEDVTGKDWYLASPTGFEPVLPP